MSFTDHKITQFAHKVSDLPDEPQIPAAELKSRFDACPEELRQSLNAVCDDAARLEARVEGIVVDTFGDTIDKEMLSDELAAELDGKAEAADLTALDARVETVENTLPEKVECHFGMYTGNGASERFIELSFTPKAVFVLKQYGYTGFGTNFMGGLAMQNFPVVTTQGGEEYPVLKIEENGFRVFRTYDSSFRIGSNENNENFYYLAVK